MTDSDILAAALRYAAAGVHVFPTRIGIRGDGKKEVYPIAAWKQASTTDPAVIASWWGAAGTRRDSALCIDCGKSDIVMIDQDISDGKQGPLEWEKLSPPPTWRVRSGSGGAHDYYRADPSRPVTVDNDGAIADGVDVRGEGGFAFAPPSIDPRGGMWEWVDGEPDWPNLPPVPVVVLDRMEAKQAGKRPKPSPGQRPVTFTAPVPDGATSILFANPSDLDDRDFGPDGGYKTRSAALALLSEQHRRFVALTQEGNARSHVLSQEFGVLAGHGVGVFWEYEWAFEQLMQAARDNGMCDVHGERYVADQARRGLEFGMREPWHEQPTPPAVHEMFTPEAAASTPGDEVDALLAEMISVREMIERPAPRFLIQGLLTFDSESWLIGAPGSKKSFVAFDMAARVSRGERWQGRRTNPADVVMIIAEGSGGSGKRGAAWVQAIGEIDDEHVRILPRPVQVGADFGKPWRVLAEACGRLADRAVASGRGMLVIVDTQARVTVGLEENSAKEMGIYVEGVRLIRERTGGCVLSVHHTGRTGGDARGSSAIDGAQTSELKVESTGKLTGRLLTEKQKDLEHADPIELRFKSVPLGLDADGEPVSSLVLLEPGAIGWDGIEVTHEDIEGGQGEPEDPFAMRADLDPWISRHVNNAPLQWWIVQALVDTVETLGLTESAVKEIVVSKRGKQSPSSWRKAWQKVTAEGGQWETIVCRASGERWSVDRVSIAEKLVA
jgi:hypothetical protein